jgi:peptide/nickel transport system substrate-binding protein
MARLGRPIRALLASMMVALIAAPVVAQDAESSDVRFLTAEDFVAGWDPYQHAIQAQMRIEAQIFDYLVDFPDVKGDPVPMLATAWTPIDDMTWELTLQEGVTFHDGTPFDAADVKASVELASGKVLRPGSDGQELESVSAGAWVPTAVEIVDDHTVRLVSDTPFAALFPQLGSTPIVSSDDIGEDFSGLMAAPNGTGPFRLVADEVGRKVMEANADYWRGAPQIGSLTWEYIQDPETRLSALLTGQADVIDRVPPQHLQQIEDADDVSLISTTGIESVNLYVAPGRLPIWDENPSFRKAVVQAIDRDGLVNGLVQGSSAVATSFLPTETAGHVDGTPAYAKDTAAAQALLAEGGVTDGGPEFELWVASGFLPRADEVGAAIAANLEEAGLHPRIVTTDIGAMVDDIFSEDGTGAMYHISWSSNGDPFVHARVYSDTFAWYFGDEELQALIDASASTTDPAAREQVVADMQARLWDQMWHVPLYNSDFTIAHRDSLQGLDVRPNFRTDFYPASVSE